MSQVFPLIDGFIGYGNGLEAQLRTDEAWDTDHSLYVERPEVFTEPVRRRRGKEAATGE